MIFFVVFYTVLTSLIGGNNPKLDGDDASICIPAIFVLNKSQSDIGKEILNLIDEFYIEYYINLTEDIAKEPRFILLSLVINKNGELQIRLSGLSPIALGSIIHQQKFPELYMYRNDAYIFIYGSKFIDFIMYTESDKCISVDEHDPYGGYIIPIIIDIQTSLYRYSSGGFILIDQGFIDPLGY